MDTEERLCLHNAEFENVHKDKEKLELIFRYTVLHYISDGYGWFNGVRLGPGQYFCILKNSYAQYYPDPEEPWSYTYFDLYGKCTKNVLIQSGIDPAKPWGDFPCMQDIPKLLQLYLQYSKQYKENREFLCAMADMLLALHKAEEVDRKQFPITHQHVDLIREYLKSHMHQKISIEDLAQRFYLSRPYIRNLFVKYENMSPKQYLQKIRMERAAEMLLQTRYDVSLIAQSVGYSDQFTFSKMFKQHHGVSPAGFRRENGW